MDPILCKPKEIENKSFEIIKEELDKRKIFLPEEEEAVITRVIHATADFDYAETLCFSSGAMEEAKELLRSGAKIVTDTNMALSGINRQALFDLGIEAFCFMAEEEVEREALMRGVTRAAVSMEFAAKTISGPVMFVVGNAPTALITLHGLWKKGAYSPAFVVAVPVGFVNVELSKELILDSSFPYVVARGRKGGSSVAVAIVNAILYQCVAGEKDS
ncbi:MAG: precorrin-8X methylmutase [Lachnospiraceae bacterium]|nr:precorrin-8X methylmutase [Lachnospiraceae bacterium]